jgi:hypothetical protein
MNFEFSLLYRYTGKGYRALSGYGERYLRSAVWLALFVLGLAVVYLFLPADRVAPLGVKDTVVFSLGAMTLQPPNGVKPGAEEWTPFFVFLEGYWVPCRSR